MTVVFACYRFAVFVNSSGRFGRDCTYWGILFESLYFFFFHLCSISWSRVLYHVFYQIMNGGEHVPSSYCRVIMQYLTQRVF